MEFTFTETVKLATKGFKPSDVAELSKLDENKFSKDDILSLISNGYSKTEVKKLVEMFDSKEVESDTDNNDDVQDDVPTEKEEKEPERKSGPATPSTKEKDDIDYKAKYEEEKKLREQLQHKNAAAPSGVKGDTRSDWDVAMEIASDY